MLKITHFFIPKTPPLYSSLKRALVKQKNKEKQIHSQFFNWNYKLSQLPFVIFNKKSLRFVKKNILKLILYCFCNKYTLSLFHKQTIIEYSH